jgi:hypothetical protein
MLPHNLRDGSLCGLGNPDEVIGRKRVRSARLEAALVYQRAREAAQPDGPTTSTAQRRSPLINVNSKADPLPSKDERLALAKAEARANRRKARLDRRRAAEASGVTESQLDASAETVESGIQRARRELAQLKKERVKQRRRGPWISIVSGGGGPGSGKRS